MKQAGKASAADTPPARRGRGRPRVDNPLSDAERARRYRERKREAGASAQGGTAGETRSTPQAQRLMEELLAAQETAARQAREIADLRGLLDMFIEARMKRKAIPADVFRNICASYLKT